METAELERRERSGWGRQNRCQTPWAEFSWDRNMGQPVGKTMVASGNTDQMQSLSGQAPISASVAQGFIGIWFVHVVLMKI